MFQSNFADFFGFGHHLNRPRASKVENRARMTPFCTLNLYMHLKPGCICSWKELVDAFFEQYYNVDMALNRLQLQNMSKKGCETFKE